MFNSNNGYSLSDIAAVSQNDGMFGGGYGGWLWILVIIALFCGGWGNGSGVFGGANGVNDGYILTSDFANIERKIDGVNNGLCDGFYAMNTGMLNGFAGVNNAITQQTIAEMQNTNAVGAQITGLGTQMAQCCCDNKYQMATGFSDLNYRLAEQSCQTRQAIADSTAAITANQDANTRSILDFLTQDKIASLQAENQSLKFAASQQAQNSYLINKLSPQAIPAYTVPNPLTGQYGTYGCACGA